MANRSAFELFVMDLKRGAAEAAKKGAVVGLAAVAGAPTLGACMVNQAQEAGHDQINIGDWGKDWAQQRVADGRGERNTHAVRFDKSRSGAIQGRYVDCYGRGCSGLELSIQLLVDNSFAHDGIENKRVGVAYRASVSQGTAMAEYTGTDGDKEVWTARVRLSGYENNLVAFTAFYQTQGYDSYVYIDDNAGQLHVADWAQGYTQAASYWGADLKAEEVDGATHIRGHIEVRLMDIAEKKRLGFVYTTRYQMTPYGYPDGVWPENNQPAPAFWGDGHQASGPNTWYWVSNEWGGYERWAIDIDIPADGPFLEYAMVYEHGTADGAQKYSFWMNGGGAGQNYTFWAPPPVVEEPPADATPVEPASDGTASPPVDVGPTG